MLLTMNDEHDEDSAVKAQSCMSMTNKHQERLKALLLYLWDNESEDDKDDGCLNQYWHKDFGALAKAKNTLALKSKDAKLDAILCSCIVSMIGTLNTYLDPHLSHTWWQASVLTAVSCSKSHKHSLTIYRWMYTYLNTGVLPDHGYHFCHYSCIDDEGLANELHAQLMITAKKEKRHIAAKDIITILVEPNFHQHCYLPDGFTISERTARCWLQKLDWRYHQKANRMYIDGHEHPDVVAYHEKFVARWKNYKLCK